MAAFALPENRFHVRSISLPTRSHPVVLKIEECLNKLKSVLKASTTSTSKAKTIQVALAGLIGLYDCVDDFIHVPVVQQAVVHHQHEKLVEEVLDESVGLLDICGTARNVLFMMEGGLQDLQSALRRKSGGESSMENQISAYICMRKRMRKDIKKCLATLKKNDRNKSPLLHQSQHLSILVSVLKEASTVTISIFQYILSFLSSSVTNKKPVGWSLVLKLIISGSITSEKKLQENDNEVESVDVAVHAISRQSSSSGADVETVQTAQKRLKTLEVSVETLEDGLECMYRRLIQTRVSLLNVLNH